MKSYRPQKLGASFSKTHHFFKNTGILGPQLRDRSHMSPLTKLMPYELKNTWIFLKKHRFLGGYRPKSDRGGGPKKSFFTFDRKIGFSIEFYYTPPFFIKKVVFKPFLWGRDLQNP